MPLYIAIFEEVSILYSKYGTLWYFFPLLDKLILLLYYKLYYLDIHKININFVLIRFLSSFLIFSKQ